MVNKEQRRIYVERYSEERVVWAITKATRHRMRGISYGQSEHFTAWEWLDLSGANNFLCTYCGRGVPLEPHHIHELCFGGANTIDNIVPLCKVCHDYWHMYSDDVSDLWMAAQQRLLDSFSEGERVNRSYFCTLPTRVVTARQEGKIVQIVSPKIFSPHRPSFPLRGRIHSWTSKKSGKLLRRVEYARSSSGWANDTSDGKFLNDFLDEWWDTAPKVLVHWLRIVDGIEVVTAETVVYLRDVQKVIEGNKGKVIKRRPFF